MMLVVGVDTGGTFTDFIYVKDGRWEILKVPSTPHDPSVAVLEGLARLGGERRRIVHGSTVATNALLERKGARVALITNKGFEDVLEIGRQTRERLYDLHYRKPEPLVRRELRFGLSCRVSHRGEVLQELSPEEVIRLAHKLKDIKIEAVAVCFLHSYANPSHEVEVAKILSEELPRVHISMSHEILPEFREYERTSTTVINAYVSPKMDSYLSALERGLGKGDGLSVMQSNGGVVSTKVARREAVRTILSGPAGGVIAATHLGKLIGADRLITFDMGGTSTDVSLIDGKPTLTTESLIAGLPVKVPMIDIHTIGAGGGSIARVDEGGILRVGPQSAGADPGPACYGRGGKEVTVTDANLFLGRLIPRYFLGGKMKLYPKAVPSLLHELARKLRSEPLGVAEAIVEVVNSNMERALRRISVQRGYDPRDFTLLSFGGCGGLHCVFLARSLGIPRVIVPPSPGIFSAMGLILADTVKDYSLTVMLKSSEISKEELKDIFSLLLEKALPDMEAEGFPPERINTELYLDMRYEGQSYELSVPFTEDYEGEFHRMHERVYGYAHRGEVEIVSLRLRAIGIAPKPSLPRFKKSEGSKGERALVDKVKTAFGGELLDTPVFLREKLVWGDEVEGPAVVVEYSSTVIVPPGSKAHVDDFGNLIML